MDENLTKKIVQTTSPIFIFDFVCYFVVEPWRWQAASAFYLFFESETDEVTSDC